MITSPHIYGIPARKVCGKLVNVNVIESVVLIVKLGGSSSNGSNFEILLFGIPITIVWETDHLKD